jgi:8-amino-7-oxononanoate synthase
MPHDPLRWIDDELAALAAQGLRRHLVARHGPQTPATLVIDRRTLVNFGSNDYLGLAAERLVAAVQAALPAIGWGAGASPLVTGRGLVHAQLERQLAEFEGAEAALLFPTGFAANLGTVTALAERGDVIFSDAKNHASIVDGCRLSGAQIQVYAHRDVAHLQRLLQQATGFRRRLLVTDSLFSMDGDLAPLPDLVELAERHEAILMVDEAHATGVFGEHGRGVAEYLGVDRAVPVRVGTLSKALGSLGGFVVGTQRLIHWLLNRARPYIFSTAPPEALAAAALEALRVVRTEPERRRSLLQRSAQVRQRLAEADWPTGASASQIIPLVVGGPQATMQLAAALQDRGLFVPGVRPPAVPEGESLLRISLSCAHGDAMLEQLVAALTELRPTALAPASCAPV